MSSRTKYGQSGAKDAVWNLATPIKNHDPEKYRADPYGNKMYYQSYGNISGMGWQIDHIKPSARGGSDDIRNLQALNSNINMSKGDTLVKKSRHSK